MALAEQTQPSITEIRSALRDELDQSTQGPSIEAVKRLGLAYLGDTPETYKHSEAVRGSNGWILRRTLHESSVIDVDGEDYRLQLVTTTSHNKKPYAPPLAMLGRVAFDVEPESAPIEELRLWTPSILLGSVYLNQSTEAPTQPMAEALLRLPAHV